MILGKKDFVRLKSEYDCNNEKKQYRERIRDISTKESEGNLDYANKIVLSDDNANRKIFDLLNDEKPVMIGRFGGNELDATIRGLTGKYPILNPYRLYKENQKNWGMYYGAGFFPKNPNLIPKFSNLMAESCAWLDMLACWYNEYEDLAIDILCSEKVELCKLSAIKPWSADSIPWTRALKGKSVLVVHPFVETMKKQYTKRDKIFANADYLPDMKIKYLKAVQTGAGNKDRRFKDWFQAYDYMLNEILSFDFEIAILGCGAYGFPLAAAIKRNGKKAVHMGSATQLLFGIMGNRWKDVPSVTNMINEYWTRPGQDERPPLYNVVEGGCYW